MAVSALYAHPVEHIICNIGAMLIGPLIFPTSQVVLGIWTSIGTLNAVTSHSGLALPYIQNVRHDLHHRYLSCNYGAAGPSDIMYGTRRYV